MFPRKISSLRKLSHYTAIPPPPLPPLPPAPPHLSLLADKCSSMRQLQQIHAQMLVSAHFNDNFAASRLLSFYALSPNGNLDYAIKLFNTTQQPNSFMWNTLIRSLAASPNPREAVLLYVKMQRLDVFPGKHTFPFLLKALANLRWIRCIKQVHCSVLKFGLSLEIHVVNGLMRAHVTVCDLKDARKLFDEIPVRNLTMWTTMVCGYAQNQCAREALVLFDEMVVNKIEPNPPMLASVLSACAQSGFLDLGEKIDIYIKEKRIEVGVILGTALVHMYAKNGVISKARKHFHGMPERNIATWNVMISGLAVHGHAQEAINLFQELEKERIVPNAITFVVVLSACCHAGLIHFGLKVFDSMKRVYKIEPKIQHYGCMVDLLGRGGRLKEAEGLIKGMVCKADVMIWGAMLNACQNHGNVEIAERAVREILGLDPCNHGVYVVLSNMYARDGRWEDVSRLREIMKNGSLKKTPGWSLVDGD